MSLHLATYSDLKKYGGSKEDKDVLPRYSCELGPVLRHGPNKLIFNSATALQDIYNNEKVNKSRVYLLTVASGKPSLFSMLDSRQHRNRRKIIGQAINDKALRAFELTMAGQIDIFIQQLVVASQDSSPVNMTQRCKWLGMDIVGLLAFGFALNLQADSANHYIIPGLAVETYRFNCFMRYPLLKTLGIDRVIEILGYKAKRKYMNNLQHMIKTRLSEPIDAKHDLYSTVAGHLDNTADGIGTSELLSEALFFIPAGGDTVTTAMTALFFYLSRNSTVYKRLATEIRNTFKSYEDIKGGQQLNGCRYLRACIDEALRMSPPITGTMWREPSETVVIDGHVIPSGTQIGVNSYSLHHNEDYFHRPFEYDPDRWLVKDEAALCRMNSAFLPFSLGSRSCAGKSMAYLEIGLMLTKTMWLFDFKIAPGKIGAVGEGAPGSGAERERLDEFQLYDTFGSQHDGPNLVFLRVDRPDGPAYMRNVIRV
ncbi:hypothetical protein O1611_g1322 [Lasiodiplodia mahajangana]|uniref:Uncharacterized protein n=1 Tax=Lasiodiplodia mahajangana TaxID=1108764 RepID=A0ACC2JYE7_9PEZI|nr:hypothetical protein O1611_g1322 [Lasiodiplodia mahajangana]